MICATAMLRNLMTAAVLLACISKCSCQDLLEDIKAASAPENGVDTGFLGALNDMASSNWTFVTREGSQLQLNGEPYYFSGCNFYPAMVNAAGGEKTRNQTRQILRTMRKLGLTVLRTWAFNDATDNSTWQPLQKAPQVFNERVFSEGLDWLVAEAPKYGVRLMLTLSNYQVGHGGASQYVKWANGTSILDFYTDVEIIGWYLNNVEQIVTRVNTITGLAYKDDPTIFAWDLINEPHAPGDDTGRLLTGWIDRASQYIKLLDSNHLVGVGVEGFYGASTPDLLPDNPNAPYWMTVGNGANPAPYAPVCEGQDFMANHDLQAIDFTGVHLYTDLYGVGGVQSQIEFAARYMEGHMNVSAQLEKPLIITEFGKLPPLPDRNDFFELIFDLARTSAEEDGPLAGTMFWTLGTSPEFPYEVGYDGFGIYDNRDPYLQPAPGLYVPPSRAMPSIGQQIEFYGWTSMIACNAKHATAPFANLELGVSPTHGWADTVALVRAHGAAMLAMREGNSSWTA